MVINTSRLDNATFPAGVMKELNSLTDNIFVGGLMVVIFFIIMALLKDQPFPVQFIAAAGTITVVSFGFLIAGIASLATFITCLSLFIISIVVFVWRMG